MEGRNAIITGASHGIGTHIARALSGRGVNLLLVARSESELARLARELRSAGPKVAFAAIDLSGPRAAEQVVAAATSELSSVDFLVNNAAVELQRRFHNLDIDDIEHVIRVDLITPVVLSRLLLPQMLDQGYGRIVNISSLAGHVGFPFSEAYAASKDGLIAFSRVLRNDYRRAGVSASAIVLGTVKEAGIGQRTLDEFDLKTNTSFMVTPEKVADAVIRAIDKDKAEIVVMPGPGRLMKALMDLFPGFGPAMTRISGGGKVMEQVADLRDAAHAAALASAAGAEHAPLASRSRTASDAC